MTQKMKYQHYLIIGISIILLFNNCKKIEYITKAEWTYLNNSKFNITFKTNKETIEIKANSEYKYIDLIEGPKTINQENLRDYKSKLLGPEGVVNYDNIKCERLELSKFNNIKNYKYEQINSKYVKFTILINTSYIDSISVCN